MRRALAGCLLAAPLLVALAGAARASDAPAVAKPIVREGTRKTSPGTVFFVAGPEGAGAAAVGAAHSFDLGKLAEASEVRFELGRSGRSVARSSRLLAPPGRPFSAPGATLLDDHVIFALDEAPEHVRLLVLDARLPEPRTRVRVLGVPATIPQDEDDLYGTVTSVEETRIEVELDVPFDLRGWGGAPVLDDESGRVIGMLQGAMPKQRGLGIAVSPIASVVEALRKPLGAGRGLPFLEASAAPPLERPRLAVPPRPAESASEVPPAPGGEPPPGPGPATAAPSPSDPGAPVEADAGPGPAPSIAQDLSPAAGLRPDAGEFWLEIEYPPDGSVIGDPNGGFVAGRARAHREIDVVFVIDTSGSTSAPSGADVNGNGITGASRIGPFWNTDAGDSILAAEVAAVRLFVESLDPRSTRVALVSFAGEAGGGTGLFGGDPVPPAITEVPLTRDHAEVQRALDRVLERGPLGSTHMAAGVDQATVELLGLRGALSETNRRSQKIVLFLTDGQPTLPYDAMYKADNARAVFRAADRARRAGIHFHTFGIGEEALDGPVAIVELAKRTKGIFTPVRHPGDLGDVVAQVELANIERLVLENLTSGAGAELVTLLPDGSWNGLVPLVAGRNEIRAVARTVAGDEIEGRVVLQYLPGATDPALPAGLLPRRTALLERKLLELQRGRLEIEREAAQQARKELRVELEKERQAAEERAERQRKELELEPTPE
jgi:Mg-chelatase subunit ChlD